jgi:hypothetical protein
MALESAAMTRVALEAWPASLWGTAEKAISVEGGK